MNSQPRIKAVFDSWKLQVEQRNLPEQPAKEPGSERISCYPNLRGYSKAQTEEQQKNVSPLCSIWTISVSNNIAALTRLQSCRIQAEHGRGIKVWPVAVTSLPYHCRIECPSGYDDGWATKRHGACLCRRMPLPISIRKLWRNMEILKTQKDGWSLQVFPEVSCNICIWSLCPANKFRLPIKPPMLLSVQDRQKCFRPLRWIRSDCRYHSG